MSGTTASDTRGSPDPGEEMLTVRVAVPITTVPSGLVTIAVMVVVPEVSAVAKPVAESMVATAGIEELQTAALIVADPTVAV